MELFEEAPDTEANWGDTIDMEKKLFSSDDDSSTDEEAKTLNPASRKSKRKSQKVYDRTLNFSSFTKNVTNLIVSIEMFKKKIHDQFD